MKQVSVSYPKSVQARKGQLSCFYMIFGTPSPRGGDMKQVSVCSTPTRAGKNQKLKFHFAHLKVKD